MPIYPNNIPIVYIPIFNIYISIYSNISPYIPIYLNIIYPTNVPIISLSYHCGWWNPEFSSKSQGDQPSSTRLLRLWWTQRSHRWRRGKGAAGRKSWPSMGFVPSKFEGFCSISRRQASWAASVACSSNLTFNRWILSHIHWSAAVKRRLIYSYEKKMSCPNG